MAKRKQPRKKKVGRKGRPVKIPADFDKAMDGFVTNEAGKTKEETNGKER